MSASAFAEHVLAPGKDGPYRLSPLQRRRRARAAFHAAANLVEAVLELQVVPRAGEDGVDQRLPGRAIACHVAKEAFAALTIQDIALAAGVDRRTASASTYRLWHRRDDDPDLMSRVELLVLTLRAMGANRSLLTQAWAAAQPGKPASKRTTQPKHVQPARRKP